MRPSESRSRFVAAALSAGLAASAAGQDRHWNTTAGLWSTATNWTPLAAPPATASAFFGTFAGAANSTATMDGSRTIAGLSIANGMTVWNNSRSLTVTGNTTISGSNTVLVGGIPTGFPSRLLLNGVDGNSFIGQNLTLAAGGRLQLDGAYINLSGVATVGADSRITGDGVVTLTGAGTTLVNNGIIRPTPAATGSLLIRHLAAQGAPDLDGSSGNGVVQLDLPGTTLHVSAPALADPFSGAIILAPGSDFHTVIDAGWTADASSLITVSGGGPGSDPSAITGSDVSLGGDLAVGNNSASLIIPPSAEIQTTADISVAYSGRLTFGNAGTLTTHTTILGGAFNLSDTAELRFNAPATLSGGSFVLGQDAEVVFQGPTTISGGSMQIDYSSSRVVFAGPTDWRGPFTVTGNGSFTGRCIVNGAATVSSPTVANVRILDMDGHPATGTHWDINSSLVVNAQNLDYNAGNDFGGTMEIAGGALACFTVNFPYNGWWVLTGEATLGGDPILWPTRIAGARLQIPGRLALPGGRAQITSDADFQDGGQIDLGAAATLRTRGITEVRAGAAFPGSGTLRNGLGGELRLADGAGLAQTGLVNDGLLWINATGGTASAGRFENTPDGTWRVSVGGPSPGQSDLLIVSAAAATLGGTLEVVHGIMGPGIWLPQVGEEFTILTALGGVTGQFLADPVSTYDGVTYHWKVVYNPNSVVLRLDRIVPPCYANCDGSTASPILNVNDFICFRNRFAAGDPAANCDGSTSPPVLNVNDFICFQTQYAAGCP